MFEQPGLKERIRMVVGYSVTEDDYLRPRPTGFGWIENGVSQTAYRQQVIEPFARCEAVFRKTDLILAPAGPEDIVGWFRDDVLRVAVVLSHWSSDGRLQLGRRFIDPKEFTVAGNVVGVLDLSLCTGVATVMNIGPKAKHLNMIYSIPSIQPGPRMFFARAVLESLPMFNDNYLEAFQAVKREFLRL